MTTLGQFLAAERAQESSGNYQAVNSSSGALGAYQVMPSNLPSWTLAALGHEDGPSAFLASPSDQDAVAAHELGPVLTKDGPAAAAAWWYSGQTDPTKTYGNPPVYQYVREVLARIGSAGSVNATNADYTGGGSVQQAGLQQAGYQAALNLTPWGIPLNPFKLPGWLAGKLGSAAGQAGGAAVTGMWDAAGPIVLSTLAVATGAVLLTLGVYITAKPTIDKAQQKVEQAAELAAVAA